MLNWSGGKPGGHRARSAERFTALGLQCALGDVVDLSTTGLRVRCHTRPGVSKGELLTIAIASESQRVRVAARVAWIKRQGLTGACVGLQFVDVRPGIAAAIEQLARYGFVSLDTTAGGGAPDETKPAEHPVQASMEVEDLYAILGVEHGASQDEIRSSYHALALQLHPDRNASAEATAKFAEVSKAYKVLRSETLRRRYDELLARSVPRARDAA